MYETVEGNGVHLSSLSLLVLKQFYWGITTDSNEAELKFQMGDFIVFSLLAGQRDN